MNFRQLTLLVAFLGFGSSAFGQGVCGNVYSEEAVERMEAVQRFMDEGFVNLRVSTFVPIKYHRVTENTGEGAVRYSGILDAHDRLNRYYTSLDMQFFIYEEDNELINTFPSNNAYTDPRGVAGPITMNGQRSLRAVNVYCVGDIPPSGNTVGTVQGFYSGGRDWIVMRNNQMNDFSNTLGHEAGHYFSLQHPHFGWEGCPQDADGSCVPNNIPCTSSERVELQDGSNCATTGDRICDTPPDYNGLTLACEGPFANILDPTCEQITPMRNNIMSYFATCDEFEFTPGQTARALADYNMNSRNYIRPSVAPTVDSIESAPELIFPLNEEGVGMDTDGTLEWEAVDQATHYLVTYSTNSLLNPRRAEVFEFITTDTELTIADADLENNTEYFYNVRAFNTYWTPPAATTEITMFVTSPPSAIPSINEVNAFNVLPNPVTSDFFTISINLTQSMDAGVIELMDITGKVMHRQSIYSLSTGNHQIPVQTNNVPSGQYVVILKSDNRAVHQRIVIQ